MNKTNIQLSDKIFELVRSSQKATMLISELQDDYFYLYEEDINKNQLEIVWGFKRYALISDVLSDYIYEIDSIAKDIEQLSKARQEIS